MESVQGSVSPSTSAPAADAWKAFSRDSPAGKALYALYNGDFKGKSAGDAFHLSNKQRHEERVASGWTPPKPESPPVIERPSVNYPKFGRYKTSKEVPLKSIPRRKPANQILAEMDAEKQRMATYKPVPTGPLLDEREKDRCAMMMRYRGKPPEVTIQEQAAGVASRVRQRPGSLKDRVQSEKQELQCLFDQVVMEIEERKQFISDMERVGKLTREMQHQITAEIKQRVSDLAKLDDMLKRADDEGRVLSGRAPL